MTATQTSKSYRLRIYDAGSTSSVDFTLAEGELEAVPTVGGAGVRPLEGRTESRPWSIRIVDAAEILTAEIADSGGRTHLIGRFCDFQVSEDGGSWETLAAGRLVDVNDAAPGAYELRISDERSIERGTTIFATTSTTQIYPGGTVLPFEGEPAGGTLGLFVGAIAGDDVMFEVNGGHVLSAEIIELIVQDLKGDSKPGSSSGGTGNFETLRAEIDGTDREIVAFTPTDEAGGLTDNPGLLGGIDGASQPQITHIWVAWPSHGLSINAGGFKCRLVFKGIEPSEVNPLHIAAEDPAQTLKDVYDLVYGGEVAVRYNADHFSSYDVATNPDGLLGHPLMPDMAWRITSPQNMAEWTEKLYQALGLVPWINAAGELAPKLIRLPLALDPDTLPVVDVSDALTVPTWRHGGGDTVTHLTGTYDVFVRIRGPRRFPSKNADLIETARSRLTPEFEHDRIAELGHHAKVIHFDGLHDVASVRDHLSGLARDVFDRWGDGSIVGHFETLSTIDVEPGNWIVLSGLPIPNPATGAKGGDRVVQITDREIPVVGRKYQYLDGGAKLQPLTAPAVAIARNTARPKHDVDITISGLTAGDRYLLQTKTGSERWATVAEGSSNETRTRRNHPSGTTIEARVMATRAGRIRSAWSSEASVALTALTAPTSPAVAISGRSAALTFTIGEADYPLMPTLDGVDYLDEPVPTGTTRIVFVELAASTAFTFGAKHVDEYGGASATTTAVATTTTATQLDAPASLAVVQGAGATDVVHPRELPFGAGIEISFSRTELHADIVIHVDTSDSFASPRRIRIGKKTGHRIVVPLDDTTRYIRIRQERDGWTPSEWTSTVSAKPVPFAEETGLSDGFAGGYADISINPDRELVLEVGTTDPDTEGAYYELNNTGFVEPTTSSGSINRSAMPYSAVPGTPIVLDSVEIGYLWLKFHHPIKGFGQHVKRQVTIDVDAAAAGSDHGALSGLGDDDHSQYYNAARHTKADHDALGLDHGALSGRGDDDHSIYLTDSRHSSTDHDVLNIDADTVDGQHGAYYRDMDNANAGTLALARGGTGQALVDPGADRVVWWNDSTNKIEFLAELPETLGGTGNSTWAQYALVWAPDADTLDGLAVGSDDDVLRVSGGIPGWGAVPGLVTDHGALSGLSDDDHSQYLTDSRHSSTDHDVLNIDADTVDGVHASALMPKSGGAFSGGITGTTASFSGDVTSNTSDYRLKSSVRPIRWALFKLFRLRGIYYKWNELAVESCDTLDPTEERIGLFAQDVARIAPQAIRPSPVGDEYLAFLPEMLLPIVVRAIQELAVLAAILFVVAVLL